MRPRAYQLIHIAIKRCVNGSWVMIPVIYRHGCPYCGGEIEAERILKGLPCRRCEEASAAAHTFMRAYAKELEELEEFFTKATGFKPWSLQRAWMKRLLSGESFAMVAPTGVGKSTLLAVYVLYRALNYGWRVYVLAPTREIALQFSRRLGEFYDKLRRYYGKELRIVVYVSGTSRSSAVKERISRGDFDVLVTSAGFLVRNFGMLQKMGFQLIVADDLDAVLRNSKNVDRILMLLGFTEEEIRLAYELVKAKQELVVSMLAGREERARELEAVIEELRARLKMISVEKKRQLVVASATGRSGGVKSKVLRELLGFEGGAVFEYWRRVVDTYIHMDEGGEWLEHVVSVIKLLGSGIVFVARGYEPKAVVSKLLSKGVRAELVRSGSKAFDKFRRGEVDVLVGSASYYGILVRGIDEPLRVRFTIFIGVPRSGVRLENALNSVRLRYVLLEYLSRRGITSSGYVDFVVGILKKSSLAYLNLLRKALAQGCRDCDEKLSEVVAKLLEIKSWVRERVGEIVASEGKIVLPTAVITRKGRDIYVYRPDPYTYIQASGRSSRLLKGRKTVGFSLIVADDHDLLVLLEKRLKNLVPELEFRRLEEVDLNEVAAQVARSREEGSEEPVSDRIVTALIVVESPTKARTIASMFGKSARRYVGEVPVYEAVIPIPNGEVLVASIAASLGHVTDLVVDDGFHGVRVERGYVPVYDFIARCRACKRQFVGLYDKCPYCGSTNIVSSLHIVNALKKLAQEVDRVYIATDPDAEGEKIAFDLYALLRPFNSRILRIEFHEVTRRAILKALESPRGIDLRRVMAQIVRRVDDRWVGFEISGWLQTRFGKRWLGAGRVQSPVLLWVADRYREFQYSKGYWVIVDLGGYRVRVFVKSREEAERLSKDIVEKGIAVKKLEELVREVNPPPPFSTDDLLIEASRRLRYTAVLTMKLAQQLFESGFITYHRTDSHRLSPVALEIAKHYISRRLNEESFVPRLWGAGGEGAHEAIRPTAPVDAEELRQKFFRGELGILTNISELHLRLYDLIFRRFIASQMRPSKIRYLKALLEVGPYDVEVEEAIEVVSEGFATIYPPRLVPVLKQILSRGVIRPQKIEIRRGSRVRLYTSADIISMMKAKRIGRPSTYAKAIENNVRHGYVVLSKKRKALIPTRLGLDVAEVIKSQFLELVGEDATRRLEELVDIVEKGSKGFEEALEEVRSMVSRVMLGAGMPIRSGEVEVLG